VTGAELLRWSRLHERRSRSTLATFLPLLLGGVLAGWVAWRGTISYDAASRAWFAATIVAFGIGFLRVPFHLYWRADAALLAQLPIEGRALLTTALYRCVRGAVVLTAAVAIGAIPLVVSSPVLGARHLAIAGVLGATAAMLLPAVALLAAALVAISQSDSIATLRSATGVDRTRGAAPPPPATPLLGALPGFAATGVFVGILLISSWITGDEPAANPYTVMLILVGVSIVALLVTLASAPRRMGQILRDVSALDRQRLAPLEILAPSAIERTIGGMIGDAALSYSKDARLMRRRYPMAYALGALAFLVLAIIGLAVPTDATPWIVGTLLAVTAYGLAVGARLHRVPIELSRLSPTLPISRAARQRAKLAWLAGWWTIFVVIPGVFAAVRQGSPGEGLIVLGAGTLVVIGAAALRSVP